MSEEKEGSGSISITGDGWKLRLLKLVIIFLGFGFVSGGVYLRGFWDGYAKRGEMERQK